MSDWRPLAHEYYDPLKAGSIDGTDTEPHDRAVWRAMNTHFVPPDVACKPSHTLFVGRIPHSVEEEQLYHKLSMFGLVEHIHLIRDIVTGHSKGYCFVEYRKERDTEHALRESSGLQIEGSPIIIDRVVGHRLKGWIPRRLGGGWGGKKEAGQLRFGCRDRPWRKPIVIKQPGSVQKHQNKRDTDGPRHQGSYRSGEDRHNRDNWKSVEDGHSKDTRRSGEERHNKDNQRSGEDRYSRDAKRSSEDKHSKDGQRSGEDRYSKYAKRSEDRYSKDGKRSEKDMHSRDSWRSGKDRHTRDGHRDGRENRKKKEHKKERCTNSISSHRKRHT